MFSHRSVSAIIWRIIALKCLGVMDFSHCWQIVNDKENVFFIDAQGRIQAVANDLHKSFNFMIDKAKREQNIAQ